MKKAPLVSVLIPAYNHESYIDDIMKSLLAQTYTELEIVITDDCSADHTYQRIEKWSSELKERFDRVLTVRHDKNMGLPKTLNEMLRICTGKYIKLIASDDFLLEDGIEKLVNYYERNPEYGCIFANGIVGSADTHYPLGNLESYRVYYNEKPDMSGNIAKRLYCHYFLFTPSIMFSRETYSKIGFFDEEIWFEDWDYYLRIANKLAVGYLDACVVMYRYSDTSMSNSCALKNRMGMRRSELRVLDKYSYLVDEDLSRKLIYDKCNEIFKEAFDMRSKVYVNEIQAYMKEHRVKKNRKNKIYGIIYQSHLADFLFS